MDERHESSSQLFGGRRNWNEYLKKKLGMTKLCPDISISKEIKNPKMP